MISLLTWCLMGLFVGALARLVVPGKDPMGCIGTTGLGIAGSLIGGTIFNFAAGRGLQLGAAGLIGSIVGSVLLLLLLRTLRD